MVLTKPFLRMHQGFKMVLFRVPIFTGKLNLKLFGFFNFCSFKEASFEMIVAQGGIIGWTTTLEALQVALSSPVTKEVLDSSLRFHPPPPIF